MHSQAVHEHHDDNALRAFAESRALSKAALRSSLASSESEIIYFTDQ